MAEPKVVKFSTQVGFCTQVGYISSSNRMTYHPQKGRGYGHVPVLKFCCLRDAAHHAGSSVTDELLDSFALCSLHN